MIHRLYADNYKCLVNFEYVMKPIQLLCGSNGSGKSSVFEVVSSLRSFLVDGLTTSQVFDATTLTRWDTRQTQTFELDIEGNDGSYRYRLEVEHEPGTKRSRIQQETLTFDGKPLFSSTLGDGKLYRDDFSEGPGATFDWERSGVAALGQRRDNTRLTWFKDRIATIYCARMNPFVMSSRSESEDSYPNIELSNFASWYRHLLQAQPGEVFRMFESVREVVDGFDSLSLVESGEHVRTLKVSVKAQPRSGGKAAPFILDFAEMSHGHRVLIAMYTLLHCSAGPNTTVFLDEPDNFVALEEIQPWIAALSDSVEECGSQAIIISHHPELLNYLARDCGVLFQRDNNGPVRVRAFAQDSPTGLQPSEEVARGWVDE